MGIAIQSIDVERLDDFLGVADKEIKPFAANNGPAMQKGNS